MSRVSARKKEERGGDRKGGDQSPRHRTSRYSAPLSLFSNGKSQPPPSTPKTPTVFPTRGSIREINNVDRVPLFSTECSPLTENALLKSNQIAKGYTGYGASERACTLLGLSEICWVHALRATDGFNSPMISCGRMESSSWTRVKKRQKGHNKVVFFEIEENR